jgi:hypothetical protein
VIATPRLTDGDVEVARVNGRAVWSSCVATQAAGTGRARERTGPGALPSTDQVRRDALDQCIAFELLAQAAEARGLAAAREVRDAVRTAAVNRLVATDFEQRYRSPSDLKQAIDIVMKRNEWRMHILELRASTFARFIVPTGVPAKAAAEIDAHAHALADRLASELSGQTGLFGVHLSEAAQRLAAGTDIKLETADVRPTHQDDLVEPYAKALYAIPDVGRIAPPVRTQWGWDVVLWTGGVEARERSRDELVAEMFPEVRRQQFHLWVTQLGKQLGVHVEVDPATVARLDEHGESTGNDGAGSVGTGSAGPGRRTGPGKSGGSAEGSATRPPGEPLGGAR